MPVDKTPSTATEARGGVRSLRTGFLRSFARTPEAIAAEVAGESLSYFALHGRRRSRGRFP